MRIKTALAMSVLSILLAAIIWIDLTITFGGTKFPVEYRWGDSPSAYGTPMGLDDSESDGWLHADNLREIKKEANQLWLRFRLPTELQCESDCYFYVENIFENYEVYREGRQIYSFGDRNGKRFEGYHLNLIPLGERPSDRMLYMHVSSGGNVIGMTGDVMIDSRYDILIKLLLKDLKEKLPVIMICFAFSVYAFIVYLRKTSDTSLLYMALFTVFMSGFFLNSLRIRMVLNDYPPFWIQFSTVCVGLSSVALCLFMEQYIPAYRRLFRIQRYIYIAASAVIPFFKLYLYPEVQNLSGYLFVFTIALTFGVIVKHARKHSEIRDLAVGYGFYFLTALYDILKFIYFHSSYAISHYGMLVFILIMIYDHARKVGQAHHRLEQYSSQLDRYSNELYEKNEALQRLSLIKDRFLANTSHELRTPLHGIIGIAHSIAEGVGGPVNETIRNNLKLIISNGERLSALVGDILDFSRLKNNDIALRIEAVNLAELAENVISASLPILRDKPIVIRNRITESMLVRADGNRLQQILFNLIGNAIKYTPFGSIEISAAHQETTVEVRLTDTGVGIATDQQELIFEPFEQGSENRGWPKGGTGLGLSITKHLVELHGGTIRVSSSEGKGTTFSFSLPTVTEQIEQSSFAPIVQADEPKAGGLSSELAIPKQLNPDCEIQIVAVDDDPINLQVILNHLSSNGWGVITAQDGAEAIRIVETRRIDLLLLDVHMPKMSGFEVCRKVRETFDAEQLPIIMLTAMHGAEHIASGFEAGASDYMTKPFSKQELIARMEARLRLSLAAREKRKLTKTEQRILACYYSHPDETRRGMTERINKDKDFPITEKTLANHINNILKKIKASNMAEAAKIAKNNNWI